MQKLSFHLLQTELVLECLLRTAVVAHIKTTSSGFNELTKAKTALFVKLAGTKFEIWIVVGVPATLVESKQVITRLAAAAQSARGRH